MHSVNIDGICQETRDTIWKTRFYVLSLHSGSVEVHFRFFVSF